MIQGTKKPVTVRRKKVLLLTQDGVSSVAFWVVLVQCPCGQVSATPQFTFESAVKCAEFNARALGTHPGDTGSRSA